jgi:hypothetical protein
MEAISSILKPQDVLCLDEKGPAWHEESEERREI